VQLLSRLIFGFASLSLSILAVALIVYGGYGLVAALFGPTDDIAGPLLNTVGYVVIAVAVFDVAKFIMEEEVLRERAKHRASEARQSLTRFISTITIAVCLEALVSVFQVSKVHVPHMIYPTLLLLTGILLMIGLGLYQRLSATVEGQVEAKDVRREKAEMAGEDPRISM